MGMEANLQADQASSLQLVGENTPENSVSIPAGVEVGRVFHCSRKIAFLIAAFTLLLLLAGVSYHFIKASSDARRFPQEGKSVAVGGFSLNINCTGQGSPAVVLEAGLGVPAISWRAVQPGIAKFTRVCSYDRAGYDWSDPGPMPRTSAQNVKELHTLLQNADEKPPYVLVGHSFGGTNVRIYNHLYPDQVAGMVLADTGHEDLKSPASFQKLIDGELRQRQHDRRWVQLFYRSGISRFEAGDEIDNPALSYDQQEWGYFAMQPKFIAAAASELENIKEGKEELRAAGALGDKPLIVLIAENSLLDLPLNPIEKANLHILWIDSEIRLASLSSRGKWVMVPDSGHMIPFESPGSIVSAVQQVWADTKLR
jgi:pimeloyl-ACP methyl ester carboxylesterase